MLLSAGWRLSGSPPASMKNHFIAIQHVYLHSYHLSAEITGKRQVLFLLRSSCSDAFSALIKQTGTSYLTDMGFYFSPVVPEASRIQFVRVFVTCSPKLKCKQLFVLLQQVHTQISELDLRPGFALSWGF